jgi:hypothetical protein
VAVADLTSTGQAAIFACQAHRIYKIDYQGNIIWNYAHDFQSGNQWNIYEIDTGHVTSTSTRQVVGAACRPYYSSYGGFVVCLGDTGAILWERAIPQMCQTVCCADLNGDGYDEVIVGWGTSTGGPSANDYKPPNFGWGGLTVLDRFGNELTSVSFGARVTKVRYADFNGDGIKEVLASNDDGYLYRFAVDSLGSVLKVIVPSIDNNAIRNLYIGAAGSSTLPAVGDYLFDFTGTNGQAPNNFTQRLGVWTIQGNRLQGPSDGDTATSTTCEAAYVSTEAFEFETTATKINIGTGTAADYYVTIRYRCSNWSANFPDGYQFQIGVNGNIVLNRTSSGTGTPLYTPVSLTTGPHFTTSDTIKLRLVVMGTRHAAYYSLNGGPWTELYNILDTNASPLVTAGSIAFGSARGQTQFSQATVWTLNNVDGNYGPGPAPLLTLAQVVSASPPIPLFSNRVA